MARKPLSSLPPGERAIQKEKERLARQKRTESRIAKGMTRSEARYHPKVINKPLDEPMARVAKRMREGQSLAKAAKAEHVSTERAAGFARGSLGGKKAPVKETGLKTIWQIESDSVWMSFFDASDGTMDMKEFDNNTASILGSYLNAVRAYKKHPEDRSFMFPFINRVVIDVDGNEYTLDTSPRLLDPNNPDIPLQSDLAVLYG